MSVLVNLIELKKKLLINGNRGLTSNEDLLLFETIDKRIASEIKAEDVANYFIARAKQEKINLHNMHLQNLVYLSQCINLAAYNDTIFQEDVMAWDFGPVIPTIYNKLRTYGNGFVSDYVGEYAGKEIFTPKANLVLNKVCDLFVIDCLSKYKNANLYISNLVKGVGSPWHKIFIESEKHYDIIEPREMAKYYAKWIK